MRLSFWPSVGAIGVTSALKPSVQDPWQKQQIGQATPDNREIQAMRAYGNRPAVPTYRVSKAAITLNAERNARA